MTKPKTTTRTKTAKPKTAKAKTGPPNNELDPYTTATRQLDQTLRRGLKHERVRPTVSLVAPDNTVYASWLLEDLLGWALGEFDRVKVLRPTGSEIGRSSDVVLEAWIGRQRWLLSTAQEVQHFALPAGDSTTTVQLQLPTGR